MPGELTASFNMEFDDGRFSAALAVTERVFNSAGMRCHKTIQSIPTIQAALNLGGITDIGAFALVNLDTTNFVDVKVAASGAIFARLAPDTNGDGKGGYVTGSCLGEDAQVPYLIADTAACKVGVLLGEL